MTISDKDKNKDKDKDRDRDKGRDREHQLFLRINSFNFMNLCSKLKRKIQMRTSLILNKPIKS